MNKLSLLYVAASLQFAMVSARGEIWHIKPIFESALTFSENSLAAVKMNGKWGYIDTTGKGVIQPTWDQACTFKDGFALVENQGKWGYIDSQGNRVCDPKYDAASDFVDGIAVVRAGNDLGTINTKFEWTHRLKVDPDIVPAGKIPVESRFGFLLAGTSKFIQGGLGNHVFLSDGSPLDPPYWENARFGSSDGVALELGKKLALAVKGRIVFDSSKMTDTRFQEGSFGSQGFFEGLAPVVVGFGGKRFSEIGYVDDTGSVAIEFRPDNRANDDSRIPAEGLIGFSKSGNGPYGYLKTDGQVSLEAKWEEIESFREGLAAVATNGNWSLIDSTGREVKKFDSATFPIKSIANLGQGIFQLKGAKESTLVHLEDQPLKTPDSLSSAGITWVSDYLPISVNFRWSDAGYVRDVALMDKSGEIVSGPYASLTRECMVLDQSGSRGSIFDMLTASVQASAPHPVFDPETERYGYKRPPK